MNKKALGKGLGAFIPESYGVIKDERYAEIDIDKLKPNPDQPRSRFDERAIGELAGSMKESGVLQPIIVVPEDDHYKIIVGERRWRAALKAGLKRIPVLVRHIAKEQQLEISLLENLHREDLGPLEVAIAYQRMIQELGHTQDQVADKVGKDRTSVTNYLRLLKLPKEIQDHLGEGRLSMGHARALIGLERPEEQLSLARKIIKSGLSVREAEEIVGVRKIKPKDRKKRASDADLMAVQEDLIRVLGTKVVISGRPGAGVIKIHYFSLEELNRLCGLLKRLKG
ncbi:MAG: ParB/RepB/Spo0J family partition protein [Candidatus Aminicenantes bacterium]|nr:ParB/RepB/Spo0J family partition protein [Candidatus Aminicenantes bacterium]